MSNKKVKCNKSSECADNKKCPHAKLHYCDEKHESVPCETIGETVCCE